MPDWLAHALEGLGGVALGAGGAVWYLSAKLSALETSLKNLKENADKHEVECDAFKKEEREAWVEAHSILGEMRGVEKERERARQSRPRG